MHQQIRTSPEDFGGPDAGLSALGRLRGRLESLDVSFEGVAPELESGHLRWAFRHELVEAAMRALGPWSPELRHAFTAKVPNERQALLAILRRLEDHRYVPESVLVLATDVGSDVLVQIGVDREVSRHDWDDMGGWEDEGPEA